MTAFYKEISTEDRYKAYIQKFWILNNSQNPLHTPVKHALPNGCCTLLFISGNGIVANLAKNEFNLPAGIYLSGQITQRTGISLKPFSKAIMAQIKPFLPSLITNTPMDELVDNVVGLENLNKEMAGQFAGTDRTNEAVIIQTLYRALDTRLTANADSNFVQWAFNRLQACAPTFINVADIAAASGYSQRRVEQKFKTLIGPTAKEMQRILQLRRVVDELSRQSHRPNYLGALAHRHGYYDQSHFIKSYQKILFDPPSKFTADEYLLPISGHFDFLQL